jgi:hypothetical protein
LRRARHFTAAISYFLVLALAGNLFRGTGYFFFSGVSNFGDWADVIHGLERYWIWRVALILVGIASYYASMLLVSAELRRLFASNEAHGRMRSLCWTPYIADGLLAGTAGLFNPAGLFFVIASALPSTLGATAGLLWLPAMRDHVRNNARLALINRSGRWIFAAALASLLFIVVLGRGLTWSA